MYYLRTRAAADAIKFTVDQQALQRRKSERLAKASSADLKVGGSGWTGAGGVWRGGGLGKRPVVPSCLSLPPLLTPFPFLPSFPPSSSFLSSQENKVVRPAKMTAEEMEEEAARERAMAAMVCSLENKDACVMCSG